MSMEIIGKILAIISLVLFGFATWIGFVEIDNPNTFETKVLKRNADRLLGNGKWLQKRFILTKIVLGIGFILGIASIIML
jgi:hypothetical protein